MSGFETRRASLSRLTLLLAALQISGVACNTKRDDHATSSAKAPAPAAPQRNLEKPELAHRGEPAPPLEQFVQQHVEEADASGKRVLVYVGATWCEPCKRFHKALASGELDHPAWVVTTVDLGAAERLRRQGAVLNRRDWALQPGAAPGASAINAP